MNFIEMLVLIPLWIRSISTEGLWGWIVRDFNSLNPFMNQVYFYTVTWAPEKLCPLSKVLIPLWIRSISTWVCCARMPRTESRCLNPFMNQVYFYTARRCEHRGRQGQPVLIPLWIRSISTWGIRWRWICTFWHWVLIPLWIRSISTHRAAEGKGRGIERVLIPLWIRSISTTSAPWYASSRAMCLNPFMNQVYFYVGVSEENQEEL